MSRGISHLKVRESGLCLIDHSQRQSHAQHWNNSFLENNSFFFPSTVTQLFFFLFVCETCWRLFVVYPVCIWTLDVCVLDHACGGVVSNTTYRWSGKWVTLYKHAAPYTESWMSLQPAWFSLLCIASSLPLFQTHTDTKIKTVFPSSLFPSSLPLVPICHPSLLFLLPDTLSSKHPSSVYWQLIMEYPLNILIVIQWQKCIT